MTGEWTVPATVVRVVDADTLVAHLDLGWRIHLEQYVRLLGVDAPERGTDEGTAATAFVTGLVAPGDRIRVVSHRILGSTDAYGRVLASVVLGDDTDLSTALLGAGHAVPYEPRS